MWDKIVFRGYKRGCSPCHGLLAKVEYYMIIVLPIGANWQHTKYGTAPNDGSCLEQVMARGVPAKELIRLLSIKFKCDVWLQLAGEPVSIGISTHFCQWLGSAHWYVTIVFHCAHEYIWEYLDLWLSRSMGDEAIYSNMNRYSLKIPKSPTNLSSA